MDSRYTMDVEDQGAYVRTGFSVYLACSLTSDENRDFKDEILSNTARIFAEAGFKVHNPARHTPPGSPHNPSEVCVEDVFRTIDADFIFFLRLGRSHGMGIEAQLAADVLLPWADARVAKDHYVLTPLLDGLSNACGEFRATITPEHPDQFYVQLADFLRDEKRLERLRVVRHARDSADTIISAASFGFNVRVHRLIFGLSSATLGSLTNIDPIWIEAIESDSHMVSKLTVLQFARLCDMLDLGFTPSVRSAAPSFPTLTPRAAIPAALLAAAKTFAEYSLGSRSPSATRPMDDKKLLSEWHAWLATKNLAVVQHFFPQLAISTDAIRVYLCPPLSNVLPAEKQARDSLVDEIKKAVKKSGIPVQIETPTVQEWARQDHGSAIYLNRVARLRNTDLAITLLDPPSTGVGIMLQLFQNATIPCLCATKNWAGVSRMVRGLSPTQLSYVEYSAPGEVGSAIAIWLTQHADAIKQSRARRERAWQSLAGIDVRRAMRLAHIVQAKAAEMPCLRKEFLDQLVDSQDMTGTLTLLQLAYVANVQKWHLVPSRSNHLAFEPSFEELPAHTRNKEMATAAARASLSTLWDALEEIQPAIDDSKACREWSKFLAELSAGAARRSLDAARQGKTVVTVEGLTRSKKEWRLVLRSKEELL